MNATRIAGTSYGRPSNKCLSQSKLWRRGTEVNYCLYGSVYVNVFLAKLE